MAAKDSLRSAEAVGPTAGKPRWTAILLAGSRAESDPLAAHFELPLKALVPIAGAPMISHVLRCLVRCPSVGRVLIVAQRPELLDSPELRSLAGDVPVEWAAGKGGIAESVMMLAGTDAAPWPVFVTTADHPLLTPDMVEYFLEESQATDFSLAVVAREVLKAQYPQNRRTWLRFRSGAYTGANLFTARTASAIEVMKVMAKAEASRKHQLKLLWHFGPILALGAVTRTMSIRQVAERFSKRFDLEASVVILPFAEAGIDVDKLEDWEFVDRLMSDRGEDGEAAIPRLRAHSRPSARS